MCLFPFSHLSLDMDFTKPPDFNVLSRIFRRVGFTRINALFMHYNNGWLLPDPHEAERYQDIVTDWTVFYVVLFKHQVLYELQSHPLNWWRETQSKSYDFLIEEE